MIAPWNTRDVYRCMNPGCQSRVLILRSSLTEVLHPRVPRCMCGGFLTPAAAAGADSDRGVPVPERQRKSGASPPDPD